MPDPEAESPAVARDQMTALAITAVLCLAAPTLLLLVQQGGEGGIARVWWFVGAAVIGVVLTSAYWAPYRVLGFIPFTAIGWLAAVGHGAYWHEWPGSVHGAALGIMVGSLALGRRGKERNIDLLVLGAAIAVGGAACWAIGPGPAHDSRSELLVLAAAVVVLGIAWARLFRPAFELTVEPVLWLMYRIRGKGPGLERFPRTGACLVLANHACWFDPIFLAKVIPRPITPMMTSRFYDLRLIVRLMRAFGVIRVPDKALKKDAPEVREALAALDRGECVVVFPEGYLRRSTARPLRRFGQGAWQLLKARPETPVFTAWIEGAWGSYTSYFNGPPTKNKKKDLRRPLAVGVSAATKIPPDVLAEHLRTRIHLMNLVIAARAHLGLDLLPPFALPEKAEKVEEAEEGEE
jgi:1-acyl-sn-glycerol-3-phosphate acyltransferase